MTPDDFTRIRMAHWRPVHGWNEERVWSQLEKHNIYAHPAYRIGYGRLSRRD